jgi:hypothetical protein
MILEWTLQTRVLRKGRHAVRWRELRPAFECTITEIEHYGQEHGIRPGREKNHVTANKMNHERAQEKATRNNEKKKREKSKCDNYAGRASSRSNVGMDMCGRGRGEAVGMRDETRKLGRMGDADKW